MESSPGFEDRESAESVSGSEDLLTSGEAADLLELHPSTVKRWCDRGILPHFATSGGHRRIRLTDLVEVARTSGIRTILSPFHPYEAHVWEALSRVREEDDFGQVHALAMGWVDRGRMDRVVRLFETLAELPAVCLCRFLDEGVRGFMTEVGRSWEEGRLRVGEEHMISQAMTEVLLKIRERRRRSEEEEEWMSRGEGEGGSARMDTRLAIVGSTEENQHHLGALSVRLVLETLGWDVLYLGAGVPTEEFAVLQRGRGAGLVCVSLASPVTSGSLGRLLGVLGEFYDGSRPYDLALGGGSSPEFDPGTLHGPFRTVAFFDGCAPFRRAMERGGTLYERDRRHGGEVAG